MARHRNMQRLYSDDYNDYSDMVPSSLEEESPFNSIAGPFIIQSQNPHSQPNFFAPVNNAPLDLTEADFPDIGSASNRNGTSAAVTELGNHFNAFSLHNNVSGKAYAMVTLLQDDIFAATSTFEAFNANLDTNGLVELDFDSLCNLREDSKPPPVSQESLDLAFKQSQIHQSLLGSVFAGFATTRHPDERRFNDLMVFLRRPRPLIFLCGDPPPKPVIPFKFNTPEPVQFAITNQERVCVAPLPKARPKTDASRKNKKQAKEKTKDPPVATTSSAEGEPQPKPFHSTRLPKVASEAKIPTQPSKRIDRSCILQAYKAEAAKQKDIINLIVVGHVDAGKSTLMGNVLYQLGQVSEKQLAKYQWESQKAGKASFAYAWVLDQTSEERSRGITMDVAQNVFETHTKHVVLLDAPGHRDFVPQVIGGASQADVAILVVNATRGEFETGLEATGGQTQEHARLVRLLGVSKLIVAVNKMDTVDWSEMRFQEIRRALEPLLRAINFTDAVFCPVSGLIGVNLVNDSDTPPERDIEKLAPWYKGPTLLDIIDGIDKVERQVDGPFRFVVSDIFKPVGSSAPIVAGRVVSGGVTAGVNLPTSRVVCLPTGEAGVVRSIKALAAGGGGVLDSNRDFAFAGDQVGLILNGVDPTLILSPGDVICDPDPPLVPVTTSIRAKILVFDVKQPITRGYPVLFYHHCSSVPATITKLISTTQKVKGSGKKAVEKPRYLLGRCTAEVELKLEARVCMDLYDNCKALGRFVLRVGGESIAGGTITGLRRKNTLAVASATNE